MSTATTHAPKSAKLSAVVARVRADLAERFGQQHDTYEPARIVEALLLHWLHADGRTRNAIMNAAKPVRTGKPLPEAADLPEAASLPEPVDAAADPMDDPAYEHLYYRVHYIRDFVHDAYPDGHPIRADFVAASGDDVRPPLSELRRLHDSFYELPDAEIRRVFNGWPSDRENTPPREEYVDPEGEWSPPLDVLQTLELTPRGGGGVFVDFRPHLMDSARGAVVQIAQGTTRENVLQFLESATEFVRLRWDETMRAGPDREPHAWDPEDLGDAATQWRARAAATA